MGWLLEMIVNDDVVQMMQSSGCILLLEKEVTNGEGENGMNSGISFNAL